MRSLSRHGVESILALTRALAMPFELDALLREITAAACRLLEAERCSVWLYDADRGDLVLQVARDVAAARVPLGTGMVGVAARDRVMVNVPDCYADPRFDPTLDRQSGFRTRCALTLPLIDPDGPLLGAMQVLNGRHGAFDRDDEQLAQALAAQCAVALERVRATQRRVRDETLRHEMELARSVQLATLPAALPQLACYETHATFRPASMTGGDTYDLAECPQGVLVVLADAAGHGIAAALSVLQMQAMLRTALGMGASLETAYRRVNDQLFSTLPDCRFVTAFVGLLDPAAHRLRYLSGGQAPILHVRAAEGDCRVLSATHFPMGAATLETACVPLELALAPGDLLALLSDGVFETAADGGELFGRQRAVEILLACRQQPIERIAGRMLDEVRRFGGGSAQQDDITMVLLRRRAG